MKRILTLLFLCGIVISTYAQKSYVTAYCVQNESSLFSPINLSGDIPQSMKRQYLPSDFSASYGYYCIGNVLNLLANNGFSVEQMNTIVDKNRISEYDSNPRVVTIYLLSKPMDYLDPDSTPQIPQADNAKIHEVARYNLQGMPVKKEEKGIQIVVYSNYTTKTVIVE